MICSHDLIAVSYGEITPDLPHQRLLVKETLISRGSAKKDDLRLNEPELLGKMSLACLDLRRFRPSVLRRTALADVADVIVFLADTEGIDEVLKKLTGSSDERLAFKILALAGGFTDDHQRRFPASTVDNDIGPVLTKIARLTAFAGSLELFPFLIKVIHIKTHPLMFLYSLSYATIFYMRLDKMLANSGYGTRSEVRKLISRGLVRVNDTVIKDIGYGVSEDDDVTIGDNKIESKTFLYFKIDKPDCVLTAMEDKRLKTVADLIPDNLKTKRLSPVGRLDYHTTGLLILTNDGEMSHRLTSPKYNIEKTYLVTYEGEPLTEEHVQLFKEGLTLDDTDERIELKPAQLKLLDGNKCMLTITEGKTHQVRRMISKFGRIVLELRRLQIGNITVPEAEGVLEELTEDELQGIRKLLSISM